MKRTIQWMMLVTAMALNVACGSPTPAPAPQVAITQSPSSTAAVPTAAVSTAATAGSTAPAPTQAPTKTQPGQGATVTAEPPPDPVLKLVNTPWQWLRSTDNAGKETRITAPEKYTLQFFVADGKVAVKADCNTAAGSFTADAHNLTISLGPMTLAACSPGSLSDQYIKELGEVQTYLFDGADLILGRKLGSGSMRFSKASSAAAPTTTAKPRALATVAPKPATTLKFNVDLVGCRNAPTAEKPGGIVLLFRFEPTGAPGPYRYFDVDEGKEVTELYERPASKGNGVIVTWAVQSADGQRLQKKLDYAASRFGNFGCN